FRRRRGAYHESRNLALLADAPEAAVALREMRGTLEELLAHLGLADRATIHPADPGPNWSAQAAEIRLDDGGDVLGTYGPASPQVTGKFDLQGQVILAELDYDALVAGFPPQPTVSALARFPAIERDLSVVVDEATPWADIEGVVTDIAPDLMEQVDFVTVYRGKQVGKGRKSVTLRLTFRDPARTLQHDEVSAQVDSVVAGLSGKLQAELRAG
ncbi:MAG: hypothetical protein OER86_14220, partial [Phycisphaerae bacterium]|nr:hypothetical protein [Phycisphaerae bacterium]